MSNPKHSRSTNPRWFLRSGLRGFAWAAVAGLPALGLQVVGNNQLSELALFIPTLAALACFLVGLGALLLLPLRRLRVDSLRILAFTSAFVLVTVATIVLSLWILDIEFDRVTKRLDPILVAIRAYDEEHGHPPENLRLLVPIYLERLPSTDSSAYPEFEYEVFDASTPIDTHWYDLGSRGGKPIFGRWATRDGPHDHAILYFTTDRSGTVVEVAGDRLPESFEDHEFDENLWAIGKGRKSMARDVVRSLDAVGRPFLRVTRMLGEPDGQRPIAFEPPWEFRVPYSGLLSSEYFAYWPTEDYPDFCGRSGKWAHFDDD